jgi:tRNA 2-thiouridine synthesizing protein E
MQVNGLHIAVDKEGYLRHFDAWDENVARAVAAAAHIELGPAHWEIVYLLRDFYRQFAQSPAMRPLVKYVGQRLGADKGNSIYLLQLFPGSPAKLASKIAGLPRPEHCL